jgi:RNA polymerase sigma-70 factor (ECF subfamily)
MHETPLEERSSEELARGAQKGSLACFGALVERHERALQSFLFHRTRSADDAEELAQESFLRAWRKIATYRGDWKFSTWLFAVARRVAASRYRTGRYRTGTPDARDNADVEELAVVTDPSDELSRQDEGRRVWDLAARVLTPEQRSALWLRYAEELSVEEIGRVMQRRPVAVRALLFRGRETLARHLDPLQADARAPSGDPRTAEIYRTSTSPR